MLEACKTEIKHFDNLGIEDKFTTIMNTINRLKSMMLWLNIRNAGRGGGE